MFVSMMRGRISQPDSSPCGIKLLLKQEEGTGGHFIGMMSLKPAAY